MLETRLRGPPGGGADSFRVGERMYCALPVFDATRCRCDQGPLTFALYGWPMGG